MLSPYSSRMFYHRFTTPSWILLLAWASTVKATTTIYSDCQTPTQDPLTGCPGNTILVSQTDCDAMFNTIQSAIDSIPLDNSSWTILVQPGNYIEQLNVTRSGPLTILGQTSKPSSQKANTVTVYWAAANVASSYPDNAYTSVLTVAPNLDASLTGSGPTGYPVPAGTPFGNTDFRVYNIDFRNVFSEVSVGPALAVSVSRANAGFYWCGFYSYQDTLYVGKLGNAYFYRNEIAGQTDFLYGFGTTWVQASNVTLRGCGGGIVAWKGTNTTFANKYGVYISDSWVNAANSTVASTKAGKCSLGRPWNAQHRSVYLNTYLDGSILSAGYTKWTTNPLTDNYNNYTIMAEYKSFGPGFDLAGRIAGNVTLEFTADEARKFRTPKDVFMTENGTQPNYAWIDKDAYTW